MPRVLHKRGLAEHAVAAELTEFARNWLKTALPSCAERVHVGSFRDGKLAVSGDHPIVLQELAPLLPKLLAELRSAFPQAKIAEVTSQRG